MDELLIFENIILAFSAIKSNKMRSVLTMLGIIIGISAVIAIGTVGNSLTSSYTSSMESLGVSNVTVSLQQKATDEESDDLGFYFRGPETRRRASQEDYMTDEMLDDLQETLDDEVKGVIKTKTLGSGKITRNSNSATVNVIGGDATFYETEDIEMIHGSLLGDKALDGGKGVCLISDWAAEKLYKDASRAIGEKVEVVIDNKFYEYTIQGVYKYESNSIMAIANSDPETALYVPLRNVQNSLHDYGYSSVTVVSETEADIDTLMNDIKFFFDKYYHSNKYFAPATSSMASMVSSMTEMLSQVQLAISIIAGISLLVGGIGVMNIMLVSISERTREIGTRKALGATNSSIRVQFIVESMILCLIGGIIGIIIGYMGGAAASKAMGFEASPSISSIAISVGFSLAIGVFFGYYPANKAAKMNPIDALRYE